jgi:hypothetical protein
MQPACEFEHAKLNLFQSIVEQAPDAIIFATAMELSRHGADRCNESNLPSAACLNDNGLPVPSSLDRPHALFQLAGVFDRTCKALSWRGRCL